MRATRTIRQRLALLAAVYASAVLVNCAVSAALIVSCLRPALMQARHDVAVQQQVERIQSLLRSQLELIQKPGEAEDTRHRYLLAQTEVDFRAKNLGTALKSGETAPLWLDIERATARKTHLIDQHITQGDMSRVLGMDATLREGVLVELGLLWQKAGQKVAAQRTRSMAQVTSMQRRVLEGLIIGTTVCVVVCVTGTLLIRRWMVEPLAELRHAAAHFTRGHLDYEIPSLRQDEIGQLGHELSEMARRIADLEQRMLNRIRFEAASLKVHELEPLVRMPLEDVKSLASKAFHRCRGDKELATSYRTMQETANQLRRWLNQLQESTSTRDPDFELFDPAMAVNSVSAATQATLRRHQVRIEVDVDPALTWVEADRAQIEHALLSLVSNAVEASVPGQTVAVAARTAAEDSSQWDLSVVDNGSGIPAEARDRIGRPFFTTKPEGSGFGLLIVNAVARAHGGKLLIESAEGAGSRFRLRLPRKPC